MKTSSALLLRFVPTTLFVAAAGAAHAIIPILQTDEELARSPIVVIGHWDKSKLDEHSLIKGNECVHYEVRTHLVVDRVIDGDITKGRHALLLGPFMNWDGPYGDRPDSNTSSLLPGEVNDVIAPRIWFLSRQRSWEPADKTVYLYVRDIRGVQNKNLLPYYQAIRKPSLGQDFVKCLRSKDSQMADRAQQWLCEHAGPLPFGTLTEYGRLTDYSKPLVVQPQCKEAITGVLRAIVGRNDAYYDQHELSGSCLYSFFGGETRGQAAALLARLEGPSCAPYLKSLERDKNHSVATVASAYVKRFQ